MPAALPRPEPSELENRIRLHLQHATSETERREVAVAWFAYLGALLEWRVIHLRDFDRARALLPSDDGESKRLTEIMLGHEEEGPRGSVNV